MCVSHICMCLCSMCMREGKAIENKYLKVLQSCLHADYAYRVAMGYAKQ